VTAGLSTTGVLCVVDVVASVVDASEPLLLPVVAVWGSFAPADAASLPSLPRATPGATRQTRIASAQSAQVGKVWRLCGGNVPAGTAVGLFPRVTSCRNAPRCSPLPLSPRGPVCPNWAPPTVQLGHTRFNRSNGPKRKSTTEKNTRATNDEAHIARLFAAPRRAGVGFVGDDCRHSIAQPFSHGNGYMCRRRKRRAAAQRARMQPATRLRKRHLTSRRSTSSRSLLPRSRAATRPTTSRPRGRRACGRRPARCRGGCGTRRAGRAS
jgi:hypothetical protein